MKAFTKKDLYFLKAAINGFSNESRRIREKEIRPNHFEEKESGWKRKRFLGTHSRFHQLAYALMLGKRYDDIEANRPLYFNTWQTSEAVKLVMTICRMYGGHRLHWAVKEFNEESILHWFKTGDNMIFTWKEKPKTFPVMCHVTKTSNKRGKVA